MVIVSNVGRKPVWNETSLTMLDYQKAVVRVHENREFMEHKTSVACICKELLTSIGVEYGDRVEVEYMGKKTVVKCAELTDRMKALHNKVLQKSTGSARFSVIKPKTITKSDSAESCPPIDSAKGSLRCKDEPHQSFSTTSVKQDDESFLDRIHPIFVDEIVRKKLCVDVLYPVKIRKKFLWQFSKTMNRFGAVSLVAFSVTLALLGTMATAPSSDGNHWIGGLWWYADLLATFGLGLWAALSVVTSSKFRND